MNSPFTDLVDEVFATQCASYENSSNFIPIAEFKQKFVNSSKQLKKIRKWNLPITHPVRRELWPCLINQCYGTKINIPSSDSANAEGDNSSPNSHVSFDSSTSTSTFSSSELTGLELADRRLQNTYHLNARGRSLLRSLLHELSVSRPELVYAPQTWPLLAVLLHFHPPQVAATCLGALLDVPGMLIQSKGEWRTVCLAMEYLGASGFAGKHSYARLKQQQRATPRRQSSIAVADEQVQKGKEVLSPSADVEPRNQLGIWPIAVWKLPFECIVPLIDCFIVEGPKVLFRAGLTLWHLAAKEEKRREAKSAKIGKNTEGGKERRGCDIAKTLQSMASALPATSVSPFIKAGFHIRGFSNVDIRAAIQKAAESQPSNAVLELVDSLVVPCVLPGQRTYTAFTHVRAELAAKGRSSLRSPTHSPSCTTSATMQSSKLASPVEISFLLSGLKDDLLATSYTPTVIFSTETDGVSLKTFYQSAATHAASTGRPETILLVRTVSGNGLIGAFCTSQWESCGKDQGYYGNGQSFLFRLRPSPAIIYHWDKEASLDKFQLSAASFIEVGGGLDSGPAGLRIDANLGQGESGSSPTYASECLITEIDDKVYAASVNEKPFCSFKIGAVELLGFKHAVVG